jgi:UDP-galactopyranose mutase
MTGFHEFSLTVVGSGFFGATIAHKVAHELDLPVLVVERRKHVGGNSWSRVDPETGIEYHPYGSHLFHTSNPEVWKFVTRFSAFNNYRHRVFARYRGATYTIPINLMTINRFFGLDLTPEAARALIAQQAAAEHIGEPRSLEERAIKSIGRPLYEALIRGYTAKQWQTDPTQLPPEIVARLPVRFSFNDFYFADLYEGIPIDGYAAIFERMLTHPRIAVITGCDFPDIRHRIDPDAPLVYTGPIDRYFDCRFGELGWRTLDFELERPAVEDYQGAAVINYPAPDVPYTRVHEFRHLHPERRYGGRTLIMREYSRFAGRDDEPYYPIRRHEDEARLGHYRRLARAEPNVIFGGRLGTYKYLDMHQAIAAALRVYETRLAPALSNGRVGRLVPA